MGTHSKRIRESTHLIQMTQIYVFEQNIKRHLYNISYIIFIYIFTFTLA